MRWAPLLCLLACNAFSGVDDLRFTVGDGGAGGSTSSATTGPASSSAGTGPGGGAGGSAGQGGAASTVASASASASSAGTGGGGGGGGGRPPCDGIEDPGTQHCYTLANVSGTWSDARGACQQWGGDLVAISSAAELQFVQQAFGNAPRWIGAEAPLGDGVFSWSNGEPWGFTNWGAAEPDNPATERCGLAQLTYGWESRSCDETRDGYCERS